MQGVVGCSMLIVAQVGKGEEGEALGWGGEEKL